MSGRERGLVGLVAVAALACACRGPAPDPATALPPDADAAVATRSIRILSQRLAPVLARLPEGEGAADLLRSLTGLDLRDPARCAESGLDADRGIAAAWWKGAAVVVLPVSDAKLASRRLGLRLARLGFEESDAADGGVRTFKDRHDVMATLRVDGGLAWVCAGDGKTCGGLGGLAAGAGWSRADVTTELGVPDADVAGVVRNPRLAAIVSSLAGRHVIPPVMLAMLGDLRFVATVDRGISARLAMGGAGEPMPPPGEAPSTPDGVAAAVSIAVPEALAESGLVAPVLAWCGGPCIQAAGAGAPDATTTLAAWNGQAGLAILAAANPVTGPLAADLRTVAKLRLAAALRMEKPQAAADLDRLAAAVAVAAGVIVPPADPAAPGATARWSGLEASEAPAGDVVWLAAGNGSTALASELARGHALGRVLLTAGGTALARVVVDPGRLMDTVGGVPIEFVRHMLGALKTVYADADFDGARLVVRAGVVLR
jgi:hypothetical protein